MEYKKVIAIASLMLLFSAGYAGQEIAFWGDKRVDKCEKKRQEKERQEQQKKAEEEPQGFDDEYSEGDQKSGDVVNKN